MKTLFFLGGGGRSIFCLQLGASCLQLSVFAYSCVCELFDLQVYFLLTNVAAPLAWYKCENKPECPKVLKGEC